MRNLSSDLSVTRARGWLSPKPQRWRRYVSDRVMPRQAELGSGRSRRLAATGDRETSDECSVAVGSLSDTRSSTATLSAGALVALLAH